MDFRKLTSKEEKLLSYLAEQSGMNLSTDWKENIFVSPMNDGEMGSLLLFPNGTTNKIRKFGKRVSEYQFIDNDGITVIASLHVDDLGDLFELDIWKTDFSKLLNMPII